MSFIFLVVLRTRKHLTPKNVAAVKEVTNKPSAPTPVSRRVDVRQAASKIVKTVALESLSQHDEKHVIPTPLSRIRVGQRRSIFLIIHVVALMIHCILNVIYF
jgi:hypothetical protein